MRQRFMRWYYQNSISTYDPVGGLELHRCVVVTHYYLDNLMRLKYAKVLLISKDCLLK